MSVQLFSMQNQLLKKRKSLFQSGRYSDLVVIGGKEYRLHQNIVCDYSRVLETACGFSSKVQRLSKPDTAQSTDVTTNGTQNDDEPAQPESSTTAPGIKVINLQSENPIAVDCMMQFLYGLDYDPHAFAKPKAKPPAKGAVDDRPPSALYVHTLVHKLAEVYEVDELKELALEKLKGDKKKSLDVADLSDATTEAYKEMHETYAALRRTLVGIFHFHLDKLLRHEEMKTLLQSHSTLSYDILVYANEHGLY